MAVTSRELNFFPLQANIRIFHNVSRFKYLGTIIINDNNIIVEIDNRILINRANRCYYGLKYLLKSKLLNLDAKINLYKTHTIPIILYVIEFRTLRQLN